jgi:hypothetical protein
VTASLPADVQSVFARFLTAELTTIDRGGRPVTWPMTPSYAPGAACIDVRTELGTPKKALDARREPRVALLFSDPTGSGLADPPTVLVQGSAAVKVATPERRYDIHVRPERVYVWRPAGPAGPAGPGGGTGAGEPELFDAHMEEVRSGHSEEPEREHAPISGGTSAWDARLSELGTRHPSAVLSLISPDGFPFATRVRARPEPAARWVEVTAIPAGVPLDTGPACLTAHRHDERGSGWESFQVRGDLVERAGQWMLVPHRVIPGAETPSSRLAALRTSATRTRRNRAALRRELTRRD